MGTGKLRDGARHVITFYDVCLDSQVTRKAHMALDGFTCRLSGRNVNGQTIGAKVVCHALAAANQVRGRGAAGEADEDTLIAARRGQFLFDFVRGVADGEFAERGEVTFGEEVVEREAGFLGSVDDDAF